jgi:cobalt-zinc-cadmium efflux system protein
MGHHHHHDHGHGAGHDHGGRSAVKDGRAGGRRRLAWALAITIGYMIAEIVGGYLSDSLALLADAGHMFSDAAALGLSLFASWISTRPPTQKLTYGYYRAEILAALANGATLIAISIVIFIEAFRRFQEPEPVAGVLMLSIATGGLLVNIAGMLILHGGRDASLNVRGAWLHLVTDAMGSVATIIAGVLIAWRGWYWVDPAASIAIGLLVIYSSWDLVKQAIAILMEGTPSHLDLETIETAMREVDGVAEVHDLHVWTITSGLDSLSAHAVVEGDRDPRTALTALQHVLHEKFSIEHVTIQIDPAGECRTKF